MEEIKSVRVRSKDGVDIKVSLYRDEVNILSATISNPTKRIVEGKSGGIKVWDSLIYSGPRYSVYSNDKVITDFIDLNRKLSKINDLDYYTIVQDPWDEKPPLNRKYGYDPYYLNNGSKLFISWFENDIQIGGYEWSDENGNELEIKSGLTQSTKSSIIKNILIVPPSDSGDSDLVIADSTIKSSESSDDFNGTTKDIDIIQQAISYWKIKVPNYNLSLCEPNNEFCNNIEYKSPIVVDNSIVKEEVPTSGTQSKIDLSIVLPENLNASVRTDIGVIKIFIGKPFDPLSDAFIFSQNDIDDSFLLEGTLESEFIGEEEQIDSLLKSDFGDSEGEESDDSAGFAGVSSNTATDKAVSGGGSGDRRFQKTLTVRGITVKNGELPDNILAKLDFCRHRIEKNAARQLNKLNEAYKKEFGQDMSITDGYRYFNTQNSIFDWEYFDTGINPFTKKQDKKGQGRKKGSFKSGKTTGVAASKPGTSKHGWGQAVDISGFGNGPGNKYFEWMEKNAKKFGWINPAWAKKPGAGYEPWHWEYNGDDLFKE